MIKKENKKKSKNVYSCRLSLFNLLTEHHLECLSLKVGCRGSSETTLIKMPQCWKSHAGSHLICALSEDLKHIFPNCFTVLRDNIRISAQTYQHLRFSLIRNYHIETCNKRKFLYLRRLV